MPPRYAYWTIIIDNLPTAFRARDRAELLPTLKQLTPRSPDAVIKWFSRGRLWESPEEARQAQRKPAEARGSDWRPGGRHEDPRARFKKERDEKKARRERQEGDRSTDGREAGPTRPPFDEQGDRKPFRPQGDHPEGKPPFRPQGDRPEGRPPFRPQGDRPEGRPPFRPQGDRPGGKPPFRPQGDRPGGKPPFRPQGDRPGGKPPFRPQGDRRGGKPFRPKGGPGGRNPKRGRE